MSTIIDRELVERCAQAAYVAERPALGGDWEREGDAYKDLYRNTARAALIAALTLATIAGLCALALHPALYPSDATDINPEGIS